MYTGFVKHLTAVFVLTCTMSACGNDDGIADAGDAGVPSDVGALDGGDAWTLDLRPCPSGWREAMVDGALVCEPWPETGRADCPAGEAHFPGEPGCVALGTPCPTGPFPVDAPTDAIYVDPTASGGDGTRARPFARVDEATAAASAGDVIQLSKGVHVLHDFGVLAIRSGVTVRGACVAETLIEPTPFASEVILLDPGSTLSNVTVGSGGYYTLTGGERSSPGEIVIEDVQVVGPTEASPAGSFGLLLFGVDATVRRVRVSGFDLGLEVDARGESEAYSLTMDQVVVDDCGIGMWIEQTGPTLVSRVSLFENDYVGAAVLTPGDGRPTLESIVIEDSTYLGLQSSGRDVEIRDLVIRDIRARGTSDGVGMLVFGMGTPGLALSRARIDRVDYAGILAFDSAILDGSAVSITDVASIDCGDACPDGPGGSAVVAADSAEVRLSDFAVHRAEVCGLHVGEMGSVHVMNGEVTTGAIGACVTSDAYDLSRLMSEVRYRDNGTNLQTTSLPVPRATPIEI